MTTSQWKLGLDSLDQVELSGRLAELLGVPLAEDEASGLAAGGKL
ncbi:phosphopantetheine-binding protein [Amycolatopsis alba]|nr:phosphopantetheine-binding protein [Amycolatopsis alba]